MRRLFRLRPRSKAALEDDVSREMETHVAMRVDHLVARGMSRERAESEARARFGDWEDATRRLVAGAGARERLIDRRIRLTDLRQDATLALRSFARSPVFTAALVLTLAVGAGANGAVFSVLRATLLQSLPYDDPDRLAMVWSEPLDVAPEAVAEYGEDWFRRGVLTPRELLAWRERLSPNVAEVAATVSWMTDTESNYDLVLADRAERLHGARVTPNFFELLGARAQLGRVFTSADAVTGTGPVAVISHALWQRLFAGDTAIVGRTVTMSGERPREPRVYTIAGVMPRGFRFTYPDDTELWTLMDWSVVERWYLDAVTYTAVARLRDGVTLTQAQERAAAVHRDVYPAPPGRSGSTWRLEPVREWVVAQVRPSLLLLGGVAALLLVITCATVGNALLARLSTRRQELAVRTALGASRGRLMRQLLTEGFMLAAAGTIVGTLAVASLHPVLRRLIPASLPRVGELEVSIWLIAFALGVAALVTILGALGPALSASYVEGIDRLLRGARSASSGRAARNLRRGILGAQAAVATTLLVGAALLLVSFWKLHRVPVGFDGDRVITLETHLLDARTRTEAGMRRFKEELLVRVRAVPEVQEAGVTSSIPFDEAGGFGVIRRLGDTTEFSAKLRWVDSAYFGVLRIPLLRGRLLTTGDARSAVRVAVLSASFARALFGEEDPVGRQITWGDTIQVVGVVGDLRYAAVERDPGPAMYMPWDQQVTQSIAIVARAGRDIHDIGPALHRAVRAVDPTVPTLRVSTIDAIREGTLANRRFYTVAAGAFAVVGLLLTTIGLAMIVGRSVAERRRELAIRAALGATDAELRRWVSRDAVLAVGGGALLGVAGAYAASGLLAQFLFGVDPRSVVAYASVALGLISIALAAALWASRQVSQLPIAMLVSSE